MAAVQKLNYRHEHILDLMVSNPDLNKGDIARITGYSQPWISQVISSDAFLREYRRRRQLYVEQVHERTISKLYDNVEKAQERIGEYLNQPLEEQDPRLILDIKDKALHRLGYAPNKGGGEKGPLGAAQAPSGAVDNDEFEKAKEAAYQQGLKADNAKLVNPEEEDHVEDEETIPEGEAPWPEPEEEEGEGEGEAEELEVEPADVSRGPDRGEDHRPSEPLFDFFPTERSTEEGN